MAQYQIDNVQSPIDFQGTDMRLRTLQNVKNLLLCEMGEVPYDRCRGFDPALYDLPITEMRVALLPEIERLLIYEPDARIISAGAERLENGGTYVHIIVDLPE